jgi:hypothetical protein
MLGEPSVSPALTSMPPCHITLQVFLLLLYPTAVLDQHAVRPISNTQFATLPYKDKNVGKRSYLCIHLSGFVASRE